MNTSDEWTKFLAEKEEKDIEHMKKEHKLGPSKRGATGTGPLS